MGEQHAPTRIGGCSLDREKGVQIVDQILSWTHMGLSLRVEKAHTQRNACLPGQVQGSCFVDTLANAPALDCSLIDHYDWNDGFFHSSPGRTCAKERGRHCGVNPCGFPLEATQPGVSCRRTCMVPGRFCYGCTHGHGTCAAVKNRGKAECSAKTCRGNR